MRVRLLLHPRSVPPPPPPPPQDECKGSCGDGRASEQQYRPGGEGPSVQLVSCSMGR